MSLKQLNESLYRMADLLTEALINPHSPREDHIGANWRHYSAKDHANLAKTHAALADIAKKKSVANTHKYIAKYHNYMAKRKHAKGYKPKETFPHDPTARDLASHQKGDWGKVRRRTHRHIAAYHDKAAKSAFHKGKRENAAEHQKIADIHRSHAQAKRGDWWKDLTKVQQQAYLQAHPYSRFHNQGGFFGKISRSLANVFGGKPSTPQPSRPTATAAPAPKKTHSTPVRTPTGGKPSGKPPMSPATKKASQRKAAFQKTTNPKKPAPKAKPVKRPTIPGNTVKPVKPRVRSSRMKTV